MEKVEGTEAEWRQKVVVVCAVMASVHNSMAARKGMGVPLELDVDSNFEGTSTETYCFVMVDVRCLSGTH